MISYIFEFEEKEDGSFRIDYRSPAGTATTILCRTTSKKRVAELT